MPPAAPDLLQHIARLITVSTALEAELRQRIVPVQVGKGQFLHRAGLVCTRTYFITAGLLRSYYCKGEQDVTDGFAAAGDWLTAPGSFMTNQPDRTYLQALEPSRAQTLTNDDLGYLFARFPEMERFGRITLAQQFLQQSTRVTALQFTSAKDKYAHFCTAYQHLLPRLPLGMVASYLGIRPETLSRLRR
jgi:CRP-like cAMP-binding protein